MDPTAAQLERWNTDNLTTLWRALGARPLPGAHAFAAYGHASWPHRYWLETGARPATREEIGEFVAALPAHCTVPVRDGPLAAIFGDALERRGFAVAFEQTAMYLSLAGYPGSGAAAVTLRGGGRLALASVNSAEDIDTWCRVGGKAFGYRIDPQVLGGALPGEGLELYLARLDGAVVATGLLLHTGSVAGVHQVGVDPAFRGRGIARALMRLLLARCVSRGATHAALQASTEGRPLYLSMDFEEQFRIRNYARQA